jgi:hypothetical protein
MIECIFTVDYEIYGNGEGSLRELIYDPMERLKTIFQKRAAGLVVFVEVAELEAIEANHTDHAIDLVKQQIRDLYGAGFELGLHLHPQWYNAQYENGQWKLDYSEYNLCSLPIERVIQIADRSIDYLRRVVGKDDFTPLSFRAGNWLFQPTQVVAKVLAGRGIKVDSSLFKGGLQHKHKLDYRRALRNGSYWRFTNDINIPDAHGALLELPIHAKMTPALKMLTGKRVSMQRKGSTTGRNGDGKLNRFLDFLRFRYPLKLDFCRMTIDEFTHMVDTIIQEDEQDAALFRPIVAIGHTKDLVDFETVEAILAYLQKKEVKISTFEEVYGKCE